MNRKVCLKCQIEKDVIEFNKNGYYVNGSIKYKSACKIHIDKEKSQLASREYHRRNAITLKIYNKEYRVNNPEKVKIWRRKSENKRRKNNPIYSLRKDIGRLINMALTKTGYSKNSSILKYLPYSIEIMKVHIELLFEPWMTWNNRGNYCKKTWNDNDPTTWTWNIDHIIPQSKLIYTSMEDENFKKCWALDNLRPYSAKQNMIDGNRRLNK